MHLMEEAKKKKEVRSEQCRLQVNQAKWYPYMPSLDKEKPQICSKYNCLAVLCDFFFLNTHPGNPCHVSCF